MHLHIGAYYTTTNLYAVVARPTLPSTFKILADTGGARGLLNKLRVGFSNGLVLGAFKGLLVLAATGSLGGGSF